MLQTLCAVLQCMQQAAVVSTQAFIELIFNSISVFYAVFVPSLVCLVCLYHSGFERCEKHVSTSDKTAMKCLSVLSPPKYNLHYKKLVLRIKIP